MIKGITVILYERTKIGVDGLNHDVYDETPVEVKDVLYAPTESVDVLNTTDLNGTKVAYQLAIPKGDTHNWENGSRVEFNGKVFKTVGVPSKGMDENVPTKWNMKVMVERYE